jgi:ethanolaminephosphotransferase
VWRAYKSGTLKHNSFAEAMRPLSTITILCAATTIWAVCSPNEILFKHIRLFIWMTGVVAANVTCSLIISQMSLTKAKWLHWMLLPVVLVCLSVLTIPALAKYETLLLYMLSVFVTVAHVHYGMSTVKQMANYLNIYPFSIEKPPAIAMSKERFFNGNAGQKSETANELK